MRLVRLGQEPTKIGADIRVAVAAWGTGDGVLGGVAVFGCAPPGSSRPLDGVIVLPRGIIVVVGVDLPEPALKLEAPLQTPWVVDGWPMVRPEGAVNPAFEALQSASALARSLQSRGIEPLPVSAIVAVGPYVGQVTQPTNDLHRGIRVLYPSTTSILAAARELATYERACSVEATRSLLRVLDAQAGGSSVSELTAEGFPDEVTPDLATADTILITKITDGPPSPALPPPSPQRNKPRARLVALALTVVVTFAVLIALLVGGSGGEASGPAPHTQNVDGVAFERKAVVRGSNCARNSSGDVQAWFETHPCRSLTRLAFATEVSGRPAAVAVTDITMAGEPEAEELRALLDTTGTGGVTDLVAAGHRWEGGPDGFDNAARLVRRTGNEVRVVQAVWAGSGSEPSDIRLRALAEHGGRLTAS